MYIDLSGEWNVEIDDGKKYKMQLPGTLDEAGIGYKDSLKVAWHPEANIGDVDSKLGGDKAIATRFTRRVTYEGEARISKEIELEIPKNKRIFLEAKRARQLRLFIDGKEYEHTVESSLSSVHIFEITGIDSGKHEILFISDNSYKGWPAKAITYSSAATDETQTNWNGIIDDIFIRDEEANYIYAVRVFPDKNGENRISVEIELDAVSDYIGNVTLVSDSLKMPAILEIEGNAGYQVIRFNDLELIDSVKKWEEYEGNLYYLTATLMTDSVSAKTVSFGVRSFGDDGQGHLALNGHRIFLRSEANCGEFPETGHEPATVDEWIKILNIYKGYGINCVRFHSHCPPEAAFVAADSLGILMQPELSHWDPEHAFESEESYEYYKAELRQIILQLANHPSFVMLTLGNELHCNEEGVNRMHELIKIAHELDETRLYANGSNPFYGAKGADLESDFYTSQIAQKEGMRATSAGAGEDGHLQEYLNNEYPTAKHNYDKAFEIIRRDYNKPVFSFEVGQYEVLPDFDELEDFKGISIPANYEIVRNKVREVGIDETTWKKYVEATGEISRLCYREEIEANMRTSEMSGISLLGLQDFPGQGTAIVGMLNSHLKSKPFDFAKPERFEEFFRSKLPLVLLEKYTYVNTEALAAEVAVANYDRNVISGKAKFILEDNNSNKLCEGEIVKSDKESIYTKAEWTKDSEVVCQAGAISSVGMLKIDLNSFKNASRVNLIVEIGDAKNTYPVWIYPEKNPICPKGVYETRVFGENAKRILEEGGKVFLAPDSTKEALPNSIRGQFSTDFWSVGTFPQQAGGMGQLINVKHPVFRDFPTEFYTNYQWWIMASQRAVILPKEIKIESIITEMDSYAYLRNMTQLFEARIGKGKLLFSSMGLHGIKEYPETRTLLDAIYKYMDSDDFNPEQKLESSDIDAIFKI